MKTARIMRSTHQGIGLLIGNLQWTELNTKAFWAIAIDMVKPRSKPSRPKLAAPMPLIKVRNESEASRLREPMRKPISPTSARTATTCSRSSTGYRNTR